MIRRTTQADASALATLHRESILKLCCGSYSAEQLREWTAILLPALYETLARTHATFVFEEAGELLGFGVCDPAERLINAAYVHPKAARRGVGRALMTKLESVLCERGVKEARLHATLNSIAFYGVLGYARDGGTTNRLPSGVELPCEKMSKNLSVPG